MGVFDVFCAESGLVVHRDARLILLGEVAPQRFKPIAVPLRGRYNRYGAIDGVDESDANAESIITFCKKLTYDTPPFGDTIDEYVSSINIGPSEDSWATWQEMRIATALVDGLIYDAIVNTVRHGGKAIWSQYSEKESQNRSVESLFSEAFSNLEISRTIYPGFPIKLRAALFDFVCFRAWGSELAPLDVSKGDQFTGITKGENIDLAPEDYVRAARRKYAEYPLLLEALNAYEQQW